MPPYLAKLYFLKQSTYSRTPVVCQICSYQPIGTCKKNEKLCNYERNKGQETSTLRALCEQRCNAGNIVHINPSQRPLGP